MRNRIFKIIITVFSIVTLLIVFSFSALASASDNVFYMPISQPPAGDRNGYIEIVTHKDGVLTAYLYVICVSYTEVGDSPEYDKVIKLDVGSNSFTLTRSDDAIALSVYCIKENAYTFDFMPVALPGEIFTDTFDCSIYGIRYYGCIFSNNSAAYNVVPFTFSYGSDSASLSVLTSILSILQSKNNNDIIANQDKNTDKVLNGGHDKPSYSSADRTATDDYETKSKEIDEHTVEARSSVVSVFSNFDLVLGNSSINKGLLAVSTIFTEFLSTKWLNDLLQFSLGLGAFSFILGSVIIVVGRLNSNNNSKIRNDYYKSRTEYYRRRK